MSLSSLPALVLYVADILTGSSYSDMNHNSLAIPREHRAGRQMLILICPVLHSYAGEDEREMSLCVGGETVWAALSLSLVFHICDNTSSTAHSHDYATSVLWVLLSNSQFM